MTMGPWSRWVERVAATEGATSMALFRIGLGLSTLLTVGTVLLRGLVPVLWFDEIDGGTRALGQGPWLVALLGGPEPAVVWAIVGGAMLGGLLVTLGLGGRFGALLALVCASNAVGMNGHAGGSYDDLLTNGLWLLVLSGGHRTLSLDARLRTGRWWPDVQILAFPRWLAAWQLVLMYCTTGLQKVSAYWVPGGDASALYYILQQPEWHRFDMSWLAYVFVLTQVATTATWLWEVSAPVWMLAIGFSAEPERPGALRRWFRRLHVRTLYAVVGIGMHLVIFLTMDVGPFTPLSLAFYVTTVHPWEWDAAAARLAARFTGRSPAPLPG
jgi:hypothetical protein